MVKVTFDVTRTKTVLDEVELGLDTPRLEVFEVVELVDVITSMISSIEEDSLVVIAASSVLRGP